MFYKNNVSHSKKHNFNTTLTAIKKIINKSKWLMSIYYPYEAVTCMVQMDSPTLLWA